MNHKVLLGVVIVLGLITAGIHGDFAANMLTRAPRGFGQRPAGANGGQPGGGQFAGGQNGQPGGGGADNPAGSGANAQAGTANGGAPNGGNRPGQRPGGFSAGPLSFLFPSLGILFTLNVIGYLVLLALIALPIPYFKDHAALTHWLLIGFALVTFLAYFGVNGANGLRNTIGLVAKGDEILLMIATFLHLRAIQSGETAPAAPAATPAAS